MKQLPSSAANHDSTTIEPPIDNISALALHNEVVHNNSLQLSDFDLAAVKQCRPMNLDRWEFNFIEKYKTRTMGINRMKVKK